MNQSAEPRVKIGQVYVSTVAFDHREDALSLPATTRVGELAIQVQVQVGLRKDGEAGFVRVAVATDENQNPLYRLAVEMVGLVESDEAAGEGTVRQYLINSGAFMMYPFLREFVANLTIRGRFGPIWLRPFNFGAVAEEIQRNIDAGGKGRKPTAAGDEAAG